MRAKHIVEDELRTASYKEFDIRFAFITVFSVLSAYITNHRTRGVRGAQERVTTGAFLQ